MVVAQAQEGRVQPLKSPPLSPRTEYFTNLAKPNYRQTVARVYLQKDEEEALLRHRGGDFRGWTSQPVSDLHHQLGQVRDLKIKMTD
jgi:hypothetical protein